MLAALGLDFFFDGGGAEAGVLAEFFDGDELVILFVQSFFYFLYEDATIAFGSTCYYLYVFGIYTDAIHFLIFTLLLILF
jgi:hypothetical protein